MKAFRFPDSNINLHETYFTPYKILGNKKKKVLQR